MAIFHLDIWLNLIITALILKLRFQLFSLIYSIMWKITDINFHVAW